MKKQQPQHRKRLILDLMRLRLSSGVADGVDVRDSGSYGGVTVKSKGRTVGIAIPTFDDAYARTVRIHESIHAKMRRKKAYDDPSLSELTRQAVEDVVIHVRKWAKRFALSVHRDATCTSIRDMRQVARTRSGGIPILVKPWMDVPLTEADCDNYNMALLIALRAYAIQWRINKYGIDTGAGNMRFSRSERAKRRRRLASDAVPHQLVGPFQQIVKHVNRNELAAACNIFEALLLKYDPRWAAEEKELEIKIADNPIDETGLRPIPMRIVNLRPKTVPLELRVKKRTVKRNKGTRLNPARIVSAVVGASTDRLFKRTTTEPAPGAIVLIDGSGSMGFTEQSIKSLMLSAPASIIAYYQGYAESKDGYCGTLYIVADGGKLFDGKLPCAGHGNEIDKFAMEWALEQSVKTGLPFVFVTDAAFCGGPTGQAMQARIMLRRLVADGAVVWLPDVEEAIAYFRRIGASKKHRWMFASTHRRTDVDRLARNRCADNRRHRHHRQMAADTRRQIDDGYNRNTSRRPRPPMRAHIKTNIHDIP